MRSHLGAAVRWCCDAVVRPWPTARVALTSYWTAGLAWAVMTALHGRWLLRSAHAGDVLSAYGAALVVLGLWVAVLELMRVGLTETARRQTESDFAWFAEQMPTLRASEEAAAAETKRTLIVERVAAGLIAVAGTLLNGWGTPLARR